jgi:parallel beta-helix repeat protein
MGVNICFYQEITMNKFLFSVIFFLLPAVLLYPQNTYFVSINGDDSNSGLSVDSAFATLQHASDIVSAGDSVIVLPGAYTGFDLRTGGTQNAPIVFKAFDENVIIDHPNSITNDGINIEEADWIVIDGFKVVDQPRAGIRVAVSDFVTVKNNECSSNSRWGIFTGFTNDILIENNVCSYSGSEHGIYVSNSGDRPVVRHNVCYENNGCGIQLNADLSQGGDGIITGAVIEGNILHDNCYNGGSAINLDGVQESVIYNNLLYNNHSTGIALFRIDGAEGSKNDKVYNNTIIVPADGRWAVQATDGSTGDTVYNNILINHHTFRGSINFDQESNPGFYSDYNLLEDRLSDDGGNTIMTLAEWQDLGYDLHSFLVAAENDIFINPSSGNYHLKPGSQPVDIGTDMVLPIVNKDLDNLPRPQGNGFDPGAYEFQFPAGIINSKRIKYYQLDQNYPNPFNPVTTIKFSIPIEVSVNLSIYNILGERVKELKNEVMKPGYYKVEINATALASGVYFYRIIATPPGGQAGDPPAGSGQVPSTSSGQVFIQTKKMILLK